MTDGCGTRFAHTRCEMVPNRGSPNVLPHIQGLVVRERGDTDTLDDHKLLWAREGPVHDDIEVPSYSSHRGVASTLPIACRYARKQNQLPSRAYSDTHTG